MSLERSDRRGPQARYGAADVVAMSTIASWRGRNQPGRLYSRRHGAALLAALLLAYAPMEAALGACGPIPSDHAVLAGDKLEVKNDVTVNGNDVAEGDTGSDSVIEPDGTRATAAESLPANGSSTDSDENDSPFVSAVAVFYDEIKIDKNDSVSFSGGGPFHINKLEVKEKSTLSLAAGTYFIDELKLEKEVEVIVTSGPVMLHIGDKADIDKEVVFNDGGSVSDLQVMLHQDAEFKAEKELEFTGSSTVRRRRRSRSRRTAPSPVIVTGGEVKIEKTSRSL